MKVDESRTPLTVEADWAPPYELLTSFVVFLQRSKIPLLELGQTWIDDVRFRLPADFAQRLSHLMPGFKVRNEPDLLMLLVRTSPDAARQQIDTWLDWLSCVGPGEAYECVCDELRDNVRLPKDFPAWRERVVGLLRQWHTFYFREVDPAILRGLEREAAELRTRLGSVPPRELIEQVTNGMWIEPADGIQRILLVPQHHFRPYNHDADLADGLLLLYPADVLAGPPDVPPVGLLRLTRGLSDDSRLRILRFVSGGPRSLTEVARFAGLSQPTVHHHLTQLRTAGLVRCHCTLAGPVRYSLRAHSLDLLSRQLDTYLHASVEEGVD
jgi:DNA-binding transcriptional ArsR family regulator